MSHKSSVLILKIKIWTISSITIYRAADSHLLIMGYKSASLVCQSFENAVMYAMENSVAIAAVRVSTRGSGCCEVL